MIVDKIEDEIRQMDVETLLSGYSIDEYQLMLQAGAFDDAEAINLKRYWKERLKRN